MTFEEKVALAASELPAKGVHKSWIDPPLTRVLWRLGFKVPPPAFMRHNQLLALLLGYFVPTMGIGCPVILMQFSYIQYIPRPVTLLSGVVTGVLITAVLMLHWRRNVMRLGLPRWESYSGGGSETGHSRS